jgi:hypothetical protein
MKYLIFFTVSSCFCASLFAQNTLRDKNYEPEALSISDSKSEDDNKDVSMSDTGAQRPVLLNKSGFSFFFGHDSKFFYQSNPLADPSDLKTNIATGVWKSTFFSGAGLGVIDLDSFILTPYVGFSLSSTDYFKSVGLLNGADYDSTNAYALLLSQFGNGWSAKMGLSYSSDVNPSQGEIFKEFYPNFSVMKTYSLGNNYQGIFEAGVGYHNSDVNPATGSAKFDDKRNTEAYLSYSFDYTLGLITFTPKYKFTYRDYQNNDHKDREDFVHAVQLGASTHLTDYIKLSLNLDYVNQEDTKDTIGNYTNSSYENYDIGASINLMARF